MLPQLHSFGVDKPSRTDLRIQFRTLLAQKITVISLNETDFHAFAFLRLRFISFLRQVLTHLYFRIVAQREDTPLQYILPQPP